MDHVFGKSSMKENRQTTGRFCRIVTLVAVLAAVLGLAGCGKTVVYKAGTSYPVEIREKAGGTLQVKLDGSRTPDYLWECEVTQKTYEQVDIDGNPIDPLVVQPPVLLKQKGRGNGGKAKYVVKPVSASDNYQLIFTLRRKDTENPEIVYNAAGLAEESGYDDFSARLYLDISVDTNEKGKPLCHVEGIDLRELTGAVYMAQDTPYGYSYMVAEDGTLTIKLPALYDYEMSMEKADLPEEIKKAQQARIDQEAAFALDAAGGQAVTEENADQAQVVDAASVQEPTIVMESPMENDYSQFDEETAALLRGYDEVIEEYYKEHAQELAEEAVKNYYASFGMVDDETAKTEGRDWDQDPNLAVWKTGQMLSSDLSCEKFVFTGKNQGSVVFTAKSSLAGLTIRFVIDSDEKGRISVRETTYEGGQTLHENAFTSYVYEHGEDDTPDKGAAADDGEDADEQQTEDTSLEDAKTVSGDNAE